MKQGASMLNPGRSQRCLNASRSSTYASFEQAPKARPHPLPQAFDLHNNFRVGGRVHAVVRRNWVALLIPFRQWLD